MARDWDQSCVQEKRKKREGKESNLEALLKKDVMEDEKEVVDANSALDHALDLAVGGFDRRARHAVEHHLAEKEAANHQGNQLGKAVVKVVPVLLIVRTKVFHMIDQSFDRGLGLGLE